jgi:hypothetical protein
MDNGHDVAIIADFAYVGQKTVPTTAKEPWSTLLYLFYGNKTDEVDTR